MRVVMDNRYQFSTQNEVAEEHQEGDNNSLLLLESNKEFESGNPYILYFLPELRGKKRLRNALQDQQPVAALQTLTYSTTDTGLYNNDLTEMSCDNQELQLLKEQVQKLTEELEETKHRYEGIQHEYKEYKDESYKQEKKHQEELDKKQVRHLEILKKAGKRHKTARDTLQKMHKEALIEQQKKLEEEASKIDPNNLRIIKQELEQKLKDANQENLVLTAKLQVLNGKLQTGKNSYENTINEQRQYLEENKKEISKLRYAGSERETKLKAQQTKELQLRKELEISNATNQKLKEENSFLRNRLEEMQKATGNVPPRMHYSESGYTHFGLLGPQRGVASGSYFTPLNFTPPKQNGP